MRDLKKWILNDLMNEEAEEQINASRYERNNNRKDYRNGYKQRSLLTTDGKIILDKPQFRGTSFHTAVFDNYSRVEKSVESIILESYLSGVSTRSVNKVVKSLDIEVSPLVRTIYYLDSYQVEYIEMDKYKLEYNGVI